MRKTDSIGCGGNVTDSWFEPGGSEGSDLYGRNHGQAFCSAGKTMDLTTARTPEWASLLKTVRLANLTVQAGKPIIGVQSDRHFLYGGNASCENGRDLPTVMTGTKEAGAVYEAGTTSVLVACRPVTRRCTRRGKTIVTQKLTVKAMGGSTVMILRLKPQRFRGARFGCLARPAGIPMSESV